MQMIESDGRVVPLRDLVRLAGGVRAVAEACGMSYSAVRVAALGATRLREDKAAALARGLGLEPYEVIIAAEAQHLELQGFSVFRRRSAADA